MSREGNRESLKVVCKLKPRDAQSVTSLMLKRELENVRLELRNLKTGQHEKKRENTTGEMTTDEKVAHERNGHARSDPRRRVSRCEERQHIHERQVRKLHTLTTQQSRTVNRVQIVKILVGAGPRGETCARAVHRKGVKVEDLELFLKVLQTRCGNIPVYCDQEECLREVVHSTAGRLELPAGVTAVEQSEANGRAEQCVRALRERLHILVEHARRCGVEIIQLHSGL